MPSIRYVNQTAPFWDFVASLEDQGAQHPFFAAQRGENNNENREGGESSGEEAQGPNPWAAWGPWAYRGWGRGRGGRYFEHRGRPAPPADGEAAAQPTEGDPEKQPEEGEPSEPRPGPPHCGPHGFHGHHGPHGPPPHMRGRGGCGGRGGRRGPWGGRGPFPGMGGPFGMGGFGGLAAAFQDQLFGEQNKENKDENFTPEADVFDTETSYVIHISLPGAKKEDVGANWDPEKSEISIAGVVYRPGDEDFLTTLALDERKVGAFEKKVRLGSRANPAQVDIDGITAKLEDGILTVEVPKLDKDYVEVKKVDIE